VAALPAVAFTAVAAFGALKIAFSGFGDALKAKDAAAFEEALKNLSPAAANTAREIRALKPAFTELKKSVQDAFFRKIEGDIKATAEALGGPLKTGLTDIAGGWGRAAEGVLKYARSTEGVQDVTRILSGTVQGVDGLSKALPAVTAGFLRIGGAVSEAFGARFGSALANAGTSLDNFLTSAANSGAAVRWVDGAITVFKQLGSVIGNVGSILFNVFSAANSVSGGFLNNLKSVTDQVKQFTASAQGQAAIANVFRGLSAAAAQIGPIISALVTQLGAIAPALVGIFDAVGPAIVAVINALGSAIQAALPGIQAFISQLASAFTALANSGALTAIGTAFGAILKAISPLLPVVAQLAAVVGNVLGAALTALANALYPVIAALSSALAPVLPIIGDAFLSLVKAITPLLTLIGNALAQALTIAAPLLKGLAEIFKAVADAIAPVVQQIVNALAPAIPVLLAGFKGVVDALLPLVPPIVDLAAKLGEFAAKLVEVLAPAIQFGIAVQGWQVMNIVVPIIQGIVTALTYLIDGITFTLNAILTFPQNVNTAWEQVKAVTVALVNAVIIYFGNLYTGAVTWVSNLVTTITAFFVNLYNAGVTNISNMVNQVIVFFTQLYEQPVAVITALVAYVVGAIVGLYVSVTTTVSSMYTTVVTFFADLYNQVVSYVSNLYNQVVAFFSALPGQVVSYVSSLYSQVVSYFSNLYNQAVATVSNMINQVVSFFSTLPGRATSAMSGIVGSVVGVLNNASSQAQSAVSTMISRLTSIISELPGRARSALGGISSALYDSGVQLIQGMVNGVRAAAGQIASAAREVVSGAIAAAKNALGIHSPSRVFRKIGNQTGQGLDLGLRDMVSTVAQRAVQVARATVAPFAGLTATGPTVAPSQLATSAFAPQSLSYNSKVAGSATVGGSNATATATGARNSGNEVVINNTFNLNEVGDADTTANRIIDRLVLSSGVLA